MTLLTPDDLRRPRPWVPRRHPRDPRRDHPDRRALPERQYPFRLHARAAPVRYLARRARQGPRCRALPGGICRAEAAALEWRDVAPATTAGAILVTVRRSKTEPEGTAADVCYLNNGAGAAVLALRLPRLGLGAGFLASASARAWFSVSRRLSTS